MRRKGIALLMLAALLSGSSVVWMGCEKHDGPAEEVGEAIDNAVDDAKDAVKH